MDLSKGLFMSLKADGDFPQPFYAYSVFVSLSVQMQVTVHE